MGEMTLDELRAIQSERDLLEVHVAELREDGFTLAHPDAERGGEAPLELCPVHYWLGSAGELPVPEVGVYAIYEEPSNDGKPWRFERLPTEEGS